MGCQRERDLHPRTPCHILSDPVRIYGRRLVQPATNQVARDGQRLRPVIGLHRLAGVTDVGGCPVQPGLERLLRRTASASTGSPATLCMYSGVRVALLSSSSGGSSGASRTILAPCCMRAPQTRFDGGSQPTAAAYRHQCTMHHHKLLLVRDALATAGRSRRTINRGVIKHSGFS